MGIDVAALQFLCCGKSLGVDFSDTMTVGRQNVFIPERVAARLIANLGLRFDNYRQNAFAEPLLISLGARLIESLDVSDFEGASIVHDMNLPVPSSLRGRFSAVIDCGTLEHIFDIAQAFKNCMEMVRVGGHFVQVNMANNNMGHGFWQVSPELIFRTFCKENGFETKIVLLFVCKDKRPGHATFGKWYRVIDPQCLGTRGVHTNRHPTYICTIAQRIGDTVLANIPQQSDYVSKWKGSASKLNNTPTIKDLIPEPIKERLRTIRLDLGIPNGSFFTRLSDADIVVGNFHQPKRRE